MYIIGVAARNSLVPFAVEFLKLFFSEQLTCISWGRNFWLKLHSCVKVNSGAIHSFLIISRFNAYVHAKTS